MKRLGFLILCVLGMRVAHAQTFSVNLNDTIPDDGNTHTFDLVVSGLPSVIDTNFGLETACLNMLHTWCSDMIVELEAPDGTVALLFSGVGGSDDNFLNTCLAGSGPSITSASAPFSGTFKAQGTMGNVNNGQNPNGTWRLRCRDTYPQDVGILTYFSLSFGSQPAMPFIVSSSNLPIVKLTTLGAAIGDDPKVPVRMQIIDNGPGQRNYTNQTNYTYEGTIMAEWQGFSGPSYPKKNYDFECVDAQGNELDTTFLGMSTESDWIFKAEYLDHSLIKNSLTYEMARRMGGYAPHTRGVEIFLDGDYIGYYTLTEKVKRGADRVDIAKLTNLDLSGPDLTGGYIIEMNITGDPGHWYSNYPPINSATCSSPVEFKHVYPRLANLAPVQANYIHAYVDSFENVMNSPNFADPVNGYRKFFDIETAIDFLIVNEFSVNYDSYGRSTFMYKEKVTDGGKLKIGPPWDYDRAIDYTDPGRTSGWVWQLTHPYWPFPFWWSKWWSEADYRKQLACRWTMLRKDVLSDAAFTTLIDSLEQHLSEAADRNFTVWNDLGGESYQDQVDSVRSYLSRRMAWMDATLAVEGAVAPSFYLPTDTVVCAGTVFDASYIGSQYSFNWQPGPDSAEITLTQPGPQTLEVKDRWGCYAHKTMDVTISQPDASFTGQQQGTSGTWAFTPADPNASSYAWTFGDGGTANTASPSHVYAQGGTYTVTLSLTDSIGCPASDTSSIQFSVVGIADASVLDAGLSPNPFRDRLDISLSRPAATALRVELQDALGRTVLSRSWPAGTRDAQVLTGALPVGVYVLRVQAGGQEVVRKLVKE
jgi:subtilisin-like proprotein convertase family protein